MGINQSKIAQQFALVNLGEHGRQCSATAWPWLFLNCVAVQLWLGHSFIKKAALSHLPNKAAAHQEKNHEEHN